jgi:hypothetical protein
VPCSGGRLRLRRARHRLRRRARGGGRRLRRVAPREELLGRGSDNLRVPRELFAERRIGAGPPPPPFVLIGHAASFTPY